MAASRQRSRGVSHDAASPRTRAASEADTKFSKVFLHSYDMILIVDPLGDRIVDANPMACHVLGYSREELTALSPGTLHPRGVARFRAFAEQVLAEGTGWVDEFECVARDGHPVPTEISASRIELEGRPCLLAVARDLTQHKRAEAELRRLSHRAIHAQEAERRRVARELHDSVNQLLSSVKFRIQEAQAMTHTAGREQAAMATRLLERTIGEIRRISHNLRPSELDDLGLAPALRQLCHDLATRTGLQLSLDLDSGDGLCAELELTLYRICQEALTNIEKHAKAKRARVSLGRAHDTIVLQIEDDGQGLTPATARSGGLGLVAMRERATLHGGTFDIETRPGGGTSLSVRLPVQPHTHPEHA